jgi:hypothetical protein
VISYCWCHGDTIRYWAADSKNTKTAFYMELKFCSIVQNKVIILSSQNLRLLISITVIKIGPPLCLVVRVPGYRSRGPGSIPGAPRFSEK